MSDYSTKTLRFVSTGAAAKESARANIPPLDELTEKNIPASLHILSRLPGGNSQWHFVKAIRVTAAGPRRICTGFLFKGVVRISY